MHTFFFFRKEDPDKDQQPYPAEMHEDIPSHEINISDGAEFLDDVIRMKEQPFGEITVQDNE